MASASLVFASSVPACSSGVSVGMNRCNCSSVVMRFFSCQRQSFQSGRKRGSKSRVRRNEIV